MPKQTRWTRTRAGVAFLAGLIAACFCQPGAHAAVKGDETVTFFPAVAWPASNGWSVELKGTIYEAGNHPIQTTVVRKMLGLDDDDWTEVQRGLFRTRTENFLVDNERRKVVQIELCGKTVRSGNSLPNGHFTAHVVMGEEEIRRQGIRAEGGTLALVGKVAASSGSTLNLPIQIHFIPARGWSVVSDIDDTIKISNVRDRRALIHGTFCEPFQAVPGMASAYREWAQAGAQFHYVSASPWQLYPCLSEFLVTNKFPAGPFHMKTFRMKDASALKMLGSQNRYKFAEISALIKRSPERRFVLVGDSGEQDPEIYGDLARRYRTQVAHIFIRNVTKEDGEALRYRDSFRDLPATTWSVFEDPRLLQDMPIRVR